MPQAAPTAASAAPCNTPTPIELLANDYRAIYTWPQTTKNEAALVALNGRYSVTDHWTVQSNLYYRRFNQEHVDGNAAEVERCSGTVGNPLFNTLCLEDDGFPPQPKQNFQILNPNGQPIPCPRAVEIPARPRLGAPSTAPSPKR